MNFVIPNLPSRDLKPRKSGVTMVMDKGLSLRQVEDLLSIGADYIDMVKLGWCTSFVTPLLKEKLAIYRKAGIPTYFGGTLLEAFVARKAFDQYRKLLDQYGMEYVEVSNGSIDLTNDEKLNYISTLAKNFTVLSEVGSKDASKVLAPYIWVESIRSELEAGSKWVITESRESGTVGVFRSTGEVRSGLVDEILHEIPADKLIFEAPKREQQVWFIKLIGTNVNLGNIAPEEIIGLETLRLGLRGDTFHTFLK